MRRSPSTIAAVFDRSADTYDDVGVPWFGPIAQGLVDELDVQPGEAVLDLGCGRGAALVPLAEATGPTGTALGLDLAPRMVERTAQDVEPLPWVEVRVADVSAPGLPPDAYDVVSCCLVLFFLPDAAAAVRTWTTSLVPGGRMGVTTFGPQDERWKAVDELFTPYLPPALLDARTSGRQGPFGSDEAMEQLLTSAGLVDVRTAARTVQARFRDAEQYLAFTWSHGQRAMWEAVPEDRRDDVRGQVVALLDAEQERTGALAFDQRVRHTLGRRPR